MATPKDTRISPTEVNDLEPRRPDAVSPEVRTDGDGPVRGGLDRDSGAGASAGHDSAGPGGREPATSPGESPRRAGDADAD